MFYLLDVPEPLPSCKELLKKYKYVKRSFLQAFTNLKGICNDYIYICKIMNYSSRDKPIKINKSHMYIDFDKHLSPIPGTIKHKHTCI